MKKVSKVELPDILKVISSSNIRSKCLQGLSIDEECNIFVSEYIYQNKLYKEIK
jgi:nicotinic acid mononucleotide adenylyltransferase